MRIIFLLPWKFRVLENDRGRKLSKLLVYYFPQNDRYALQLIFLSAPGPVLSLIPSFSLSDVLCDPTDLIWRKRTPFEAMTGRTAPSPDVS